MIRGSNPHGRIRSERERLFLALPESFPVSITGFPFAAPPGKEFAHRGEFLDF